MDTALVYVGIGEVGNNRGPEIDRFLASVGLNPGYAYCAAAVSYWLTAADSVDYPRVRSALAQDFITDTSIDARLVLRGSVNPEWGWIGVHKKGQGPYGHTWFVVWWDGQCGWTVEANTSSGAYGNQRDGDGIYMKRRCIYPGSYFRITHFTPVIYD